MTTSFLHRLSGLLAMPCADNPTVAMMEAAYRHHGLPWRYMNCEVGSENLADAVRGAQALGWAGFHCALPHKTSVIQYLSGLAPSAQIIGSVNTVVRNSTGQWIGENTDGQGFLQALRDVTNPTGKAVVVLGAGEAARAVAVELALAGVSKIVIVNRSPAAGLALANLNNERTKVPATYRAWDAVLQIPKGTNLLVNCTSVGMGNRDAALDIDWSTLQAGMVVADITPNPPKTHLIRTAEEKSCVVIDGLGMLVNQGAITFRLWTGMEANRGVMRWALGRVLGLSS